jgi:hypothetical protein
MTSAATPVTYREDIIELLNKVRQDPDPYQIEKWESVSAKKWLDPPHELIKTPYHIYNTTFIHVMYKCNVMHHGPVIGEGGWVDTSFRYSNSQ